MDDLDLTPEEEAEFASSDEELMDPMERSMLDRLDKLGALLNSLQQSIEGLHEAFQHASRPRKVVRGPDNRVIGIE